MGYRNRTRETRLMGRAVRERWPVTDKQRKACVKALEEIVKEPRSQREQLNAIKTTILADRLNLDVERNEIARQAIGPTEVVIQYEVTDASPCQLPADNGQPADPVAPPTDLPGIAG